MSIFPTKSFLCLDLGAGSIKAAEFELDSNGGLALKRYGLKPLGLDGLQESRREKAVQAAVREILATLGTSARVASLCAPGFAVFSKFIKLPPVDSARVRQMIQYEARQNIPYPIEQAVWDFQIMGALPTGELEVLLVAMKTETIEGLFRNAEAASLKPQIVDASPAALANAFRFNYGDLNEPAMLLDIGAKTSNVLIFEKGKFFARNINIGANSITQEFIAESKLPWAKAEEIKISEGFVSLGGAYEDPENPHQTALAKISRQVLTRLHIQINQTVQFYRGQQGGSPPARLFLAGGASIMPYTAQFFAEKLGVAVEHFNPFRNVTVDPSIDLEDLGKVAHSFGEVVGLGLRNLAQCPIELNLIPKTIRKKQSLEKKIPYFYAATASLVAAILAIGAFYGRTAEVKRETLAQLTERLAPLQRQTEELDHHRAEIKRLSNEIDVYTGYLKNRYFWPEALVEMRNLLVKAEEKTARPGQDIGVWIENFGVVYDEEPEPEEFFQSPYSYPANFINLSPEMLRRYFPQLHEALQRNGSLMSLTNGIATAAPKSPALNTNLVTIHVKFRAVNLNQNSDASANGRLAFAVADEFKKSDLFDPSGTKLTGEIEEPEPAPPQFGTFRFGMTLKLKNEMQL